MKTRKKKEQHLRAARKEILLCFRKSCILFQYRTMNRKGRGKGKNHRSWLRLLSKILYWQQKKKIARSLHAHEERGNVSSIRTHLQLQQVMRKILCVRVVKKSTRSLQQRIGFSAKSVRSGGMKHAPVMRVMVFFSVILANAYSWRQLCVLFKACAYKSAQFLFLI